MQGVIYARYSSDNQREESIEGQIRENTAYANKNGIDIVGTYIDRAYSAKTDNRPEFQRMIKDSAKKGFDVVIVWKLDRFPYALRFSLLFSLPLDTFPFLCYTVFILLIGERYEFRYS